MESSELSTLALVFALGAFAFLVVLPFRTIGLICSIVSIVPAVIVIRRSGPSIRSVAAVLIASASLAYAFYAVFVGQVYY